MAITKSDIQNFALGAGFPAICAAFGAAAGEPYCGLTAGAGVTVLTGVAGINSVGRPLALSGRTRATIAGGIAISTAITAAVTEGVHYLL